MNNTNVYFEAVPNTFYKIVPVQEPTKALSYAPSNKLVGVGEFLNN